MSVELKDCPFCHKPAVFVGVHDNEGNYKGVPGCEYESDPWSGLSYGLHHKGWGKCVLCTYGEAEVMGGVLFDTAEQAARYWNYGGNAEKVRLSRVWDVAHLSMKNLVKATGTSQVNFAKQVAIPLRTVQSWCLGERECPAYVRFLIAEHFHLL